MALEQADGGLVDVDAKRLPARLRARSAVVRPLPNSCCLTWKSTRRERARDCSTQRLVLMHGFAVRWAPPDDNTQKRAYQYTCLRARCAPESQENARRVQLANGPHPYDNETVSTQVLQRSATSVS